MISGFSGLNTSKSEGKRHPVMYFRRELSLN